MLPQLMDLDRFAILCDLGLQVLGMDLSMGQDEFLLETLEVTFEFCDFRTKGRVLDVELPGVAETRESTQSSWVVAVLPAVLAAAAISAPMTAVATAQMIVAAEA